MKSKTYFITIIFFLLIAFDTKGQTTVSGSVSGTWTRANSPYIVVGNIKVQEGDTLIIEPGVQVLFDGHFYLLSSGHLQAKGTESDSIIFTRNHPDLIWAGISLYEGSGQSVLEYCRIEYSDQSGIDITQSYPTIRHCHILNNTDVGSTYQAGAGGGINVNSADPFIAYNVIEHNSAGRGGGIHIDGNPYDRPGVCIIKYNIFRNNTATWGGGIRIFAGDPIILHNVLDGNSVADSVYGGNIYVFPSTHPQIINNIIVKSPSGSGLLDLSNSIIKYNDVWKNRTYDYVNTSPGIGDISADPLFVGGTSYDYHLQPNSPCINAGDPGAPLDPDNTRADMGAFYFGTDQPPLPVSNLIAQPGNGKITLKWNNPNIIDYAHTRVVRNKLSFPQNPDDGISIYEDIRNICQDTNLVNGQTYYYGVFVYDAGRFVSSPNYISAIPEDIQTSVIRVPWDYLKIQAALNAANSGDTVLVYPGRYSTSMNGEVFPINMADSVVLMSKSGRDSTILDAERTNLVIIGANYAIISGFTITGGFNSSITVNPGGFYGDPSGGGILCNNVVKMRIIDNKIINNEANGQYMWDGRGGGIFCWSSDVEIINNEISLNIVGRDAGGIYCCERDPSGSWRKKILILHNQINFNKEEGIVLDGVTARVGYNLVVGNWMTKSVVGAGAPPGGIHVDHLYWGSADIYNNTVANNSGGSGITFSISSSYQKLPTIWNNIVGGHLENIGGCVAKYCLIEGGFPGEGNICTSPQFLGGEPFDYHLSSYSPCIDAGDPNSPLDPDGTRADIGAYYFNHTDFSNMEIPQQQFVIHIAQHKDTSLTLNVYNKGNWPLRYKIFDETGNNLEGATKPDEFGYSWIDSDNSNGPQFEWNEIDTIGSKIKIHENVKLPFPFSFYTNLFSSLDILYYGLLNFNFKVPFEENNDKIPSFFPPNNLIAAFWDAFEINQQPGSIYYFSDEKNNRFIVEYKDLQRNSGQGPKETFQIILNSDGSIVYQYKDVTLINSATVGIENSTGRYGVQIAYNQEYLHDSLAVKIFIGASWLDVPFSYHQVEPGFNEEVTIKISSATLQPGNYDAFIVIESNDPDQATVKIPVYLNINPSGGDHISPSRITDLSVRSISDSSITLIWTATGDDSIAGIAAQYDIRYHTHAPSTDTTAWWVQANEFSYPSTPSPAGKQDSVTISKLLPDSTYYFALKISDDSGNWSEISNIVSVMPVPVELISFEAKAFENSVLLMWSTATESNNWGFEVQRSEDRREFRAIGFINGQGTSVKPRIYQFEDRNLSVGTEYHYRLKQIDLDGSFLYSGIISVNVGVPETFALSQNYPNPFNSLTAIKYQLPKDCHVRLKIFNALGQQVTTLVNEPKKAGYYLISWDTTGQASGVYFCILQTNEYKKVQKMLLLQ